ncbi:MAG TPA: hypothetical protein VGZ03_02285 [Acidimicrobiales bacterium]|nr:hypothetical protein [Acidimicrobiales bacterium]
MSTVRRLRSPAPSAIVDLLCAPPEAAPPATARLAEVLAARLVATPRAAPSRLDAFVAEYGAARFATAFRWSAKAARRPLGTGALRRLVAGTSRELLGAAREEVDATCDRAQRGLARRGALGTWLAAAPAEVRALCAVEAATWAWGLCHLVDYDAHAGRLAVGVPDAWFDVPGGRTTLHGRRDAMSAGVAGGLLRLRDGAPGVRAHDGLLVDGLVAAISGSAPCAPTRVVGAWPDAGVVLGVELDADTVRRAARVVVACAATFVPAAAPSAAPVLAA